MKLKLLFVVFVSFFAFSNVEAQKVKFKKDKVELDGEQVFGFDRRELGDEISIYSLDEEDELIFMILDRNGTKTYNDDNFIKIVFIEQKVTIESSALAQDTWKSVLKKMFKQKVLTKDGKVNGDKIEIFNAKYGNY